MLEMLPPFLVFFAGALVLPFLPRAARAWAFLVPPLLALWVILGLEDGATLTYAFLNFDLVPLRVDRLSLLFGIIFAIAAFIGGVYALHVKDTGEQVSALLYIGGAMGAVFAGDLFTLLVFWEVMAVTSTYLIWARRTTESHAAAMRYIYVHLFGGALLMAGILLFYGETGSLAFEPFEVQSAATWLILLGFALNSAIPPLHAWLADAYPEATVTGAVFMSAFTTKTAVYTLSRGFAGWEILIPAGVIMALYGVVYAVLSDDIRRLLAYHIVSQVGFMVAAIGMGSAMAINGATGHAFTHILYKGLLFMGAGVVLYSTGKSKLSELGGLWRYMPWTVTLYMVGAFSISGFPLFSGYVSKAVTMQAASVLDLSFVYVLLYLASIGTFLHTGLKLPYFTWWGHEKKYEVRAIPWNMIAAMAIAAAINVYIGIKPSSLYAILPYEMDYNPYTFTYVVRAAQLLGFTFLAFWLFRHLLGGEAKLALDTDWFYRRPARAAYFLGPQAVASAFGAVERGVYGVVGAVVRVGKDPVGWATGQIEPGAPSGGDTASTSFRITLRFGIVVVIASLLLVFLGILI